MKAPNEQCSDLGKTILYLSRQDVRSVGVGMAEVIQAMTLALGEKGEGRVEMPPKPGIHTNGDAFIHAMPAFVPSAGAAGVKWIGGYPDKLARYGLPYITGLLILNDVETGVPLAVMDATTVTAMRTGAVSAVAAGHLARPDSRVLAVFGCGVQARTQLEALALALPALEEVRCFDIVPENLARYVEEGQGRCPGLHFVSAPNAETAAVGADVLVSAGPILKSPTPTIRAEWLGEGSLALPIDFDSYFRPEALRLADRYYVDDRAQYAYYCEHGYFGGAPQGAEIAGDLGELATGRVAGRRSDAERIVSMNLGLALEDVVTARLVYDRALERGVGQWLGL